MGLDTKMFIAVKKEAILEIMPKVITALNKWQRNELDAYADLKGFENRIAFIFRDKYSGVNKHLKEYSNGISSCDTHDFGSFNISFTVNHEVRQLFITHSCSCDYSDTYKGDKIIFSLGCWGMSEEIMMVVAKSIDDMGDLYYVKNDCSDDFVKLEPSVA
tara:strand:- start:9 stop:488 length:480 start_codon:yes stop_codon:yes gene_type:complete